ncbi:MAG: helix-hairpin-helix domain-containing protein [Candidatus Caldatribacteriota bacterium]|nr:helix-hairpin-helix domain-containing protein [Candidatus Caldatribacteriota bacterium]
MLDFSKQEKITIIVLITIIIIVAGSLLYKNYYSRNTFDIVSPVETTIDNNNAPIEEKEIPLIVHVAGAVEEPGVYQLDKDDRVIDAIKAAGGETEKANLDAINLAAFIKDGQKIIVPFIVSDNPDEVDKNKVFNNSEITYSSSSSFSSNSKININVVNESRLQDLPGIGPVLSGRIVDYRNQNGLFGMIDDIKDVSGIGEKKFEGIKDLICVQ